MGKPVKFPNDSKLEGKGLITLDDRVRIPHHVEDQDDGLKPEDEFE